VGSEAPSGPLENRLYWMALQEKKNKKIAALVAVQNA
jgi:hypothetical protein